MAGPTVQITLAGDASSLDRALSRAGKAALDAGKDFDRAGNDAKEFGHKMDGVNSAVDTSEGKFMATADLLDGLGGAFGLPIGGAVDMARSFGDIASGLTGALIPALQSAWAVMAANPMVAVVAGIVAVGAALVVAYQKFEGFRNFVDGLAKFFKEMPGKLAEAGKELFTWMPKLAKISFNETLDLAARIIPNMQKAMFPPLILADKIPILNRLVLTKLPVPKLAAGGIVTKPTMAMIGERGPEAVVPLGPGGAFGAGAAMGGGGVVINVHGNVLDGRQLGDLVQAALLDKKRRSGALGLA